MSFGFLGLETFFKVVICHYFKRQAPSMKNLCFGYSPLELLRGGSGLPAW
jgi:hypothetical protein